jgi:hypothetical protein
LFGELCKGDNTLNVKAGNNKKETITKSGGRQKFPGR